jgi:predicted transposase YbfD/YdcC
MEGKKLKGVSPSGRGNDGFYILNARVSENRLCVAQEKVEDKSNEITATANVLKSLDITDAVISIDAIGTQTAVANQIIEQQGHYFLSVKGNRESLSDDIECAFKVNGGYDISEDIEKDHGRIDTRRCRILPAKEFVLDEILSTWRDLKTLIKIEATRELKGEVQYEVRYYISDEAEQPAAYYKDLAGGHWSIENQLHLHLDVTFNEDDCRTGEKKAPENLSTIRQPALQIISNANDKLSLKKRQYKAALDIHYMKSLINF